MTLDIALTVLFVLSLLAFLASTFLFGEEKPCIVPWIGVPICLLRCVGSHTARPDTRRRIALPARLIRSRIDASS